MLSVGRLPPPVSPPITTTKTTANFSYFLSHFQPYKKHSFTSPKLLHFHGNYAALFVMKRTGLCLFAQKKLQNSNFSGNKVQSQDFDDGFDVDEDEFDEIDVEDDDDDDVDDDDEDEDEEWMVPFKEMNSWHKKKPKGFGEGKVYDTSIEDKLLVELEKFREAQLVNIENLKKNGAKLNEAPKDPKKELKASEVSPGSVRVRINNLPKKKNIHRDLKSAFEGVRGIDKILPMVSGTKKTRDPVCKGYAFVDFKSLEDANRFVQGFSGQNIAFGKTEKTIKCEVLKPSDASNSGPAQDEYGNISEPSMAVLENKSDQVGDSVVQNPELDSWEDVDFDDEDEDEDEDEDSDDEDITRSFKLSDSTGQSKIESVESKLLKQLSKTPSTKQKTKKVGKKKPAAQKNSASATKIKVPGSAKRLKVHEKAKLADVYSRYGVKQEAVASKET